MIAASVGFQTELAEMRTKLTDIDAATINGSNLMSPFSTC